LNDISLTLPVEDMYVNAIYSDKRKYVYNLNLQMCVIVVCLIKARCPWALGSFFPSFIYPCCISLDARTPLETVVDALSQTRILQVFARSVIMLSAFLCGTLEFDSRKVYM